MFKQFPQAASEVPWKQVVAQQLLLERLSNWWWEHWYCANLAIHFEEGFDEHWGLGSVEED